MAPKSPRRSSSPPERIRDEGYETGDLIQPDDGIDDDDEGYATSSAASFVTSIASEIRRGIELHGRTYPAYGMNEYGLPVDELEQDRNDLQHCKFNLILGGKHHLAPISPVPQNILDLGTGTGIWAIDVADAYSTANVIGTDLAPVQPSWVPPNCVFEIEDIESDWLYTPNSFDFIHARELLLSIRDWDKLIRQAFTHLKPGGYLELASTYPRVNCDDGTVPPDWAYEEIPRLFFQIGEAIGASGEAPRQFKSRMEAAGFVDVVESVFKVPSAPWPKDKRLKHTGALELANFDSGSEAFTKRGFIDILKRDPADLQVIVERARKEARDPSVHAYLYYYNVYGKRP